MAYRTMRRRVHVLSVKFISKRPGFQSAATTFSYLLRPGIITSRPNKIFSHDLIEHCVSYLFGIVQSSVSLDGWYIEYVVLCRSTHLDLGDHVHVYWQNNITSYYHTWRSFNNSSFSVKRRSCSLSFDSFAGSSAFFCGSDACWSCWLVVCSEEFESGVVWAV